MRIMQVNGFAPTSQNRMTFKRNESSVRELYKEALLLFLDEHEAMQRALASSTTSVAEAKAQRFSDTLVATYQELAEKAATALGNNSKDTDDVKALVTADRFFSINASMSPTPTPEALDLYTQSTIRVAKIKQARPDLAPIFSKKA